MYKMVLPAVICNSLSVTYTLKIQYYAYESLNKDNIINNSIKLVLIHADALVGIASNINAGLHQHMHFKYNSYSHYILVHHNVKFCSCRQAE